MFFGNREIEIADRDTKHQLQRPAWNIHGFKDMFKIYSFEAQFLKPKQGPALSFPIIGNFIFLRTVIGAIGEKNVYELLNN